MHLQSQNKSKAIIWNICQWYAPFTQEITHTDIIYFDTLSNNVIETFTEHVSSFLPKYNPMTPNSGHSSLFLVIEAHINRVVISIKAGVKGGEPWGSPQPSIACWMIFPHAAADQLHCAGQNDGDRKMSTELGSPWLSTGWCQTISHIVGLKSLFKLLLSFINMLPSNSSESKWQEQVQ